MVLSKRKGYMVERKVRKILERNGWKVVRASGSLGDVDLVALKNRKCFLFQVKSTRKEKFYFYGERKKKIEGFPYYLVVDFGNNVIKVVKPKKVVRKKDGIDITRFIKHPPK